MTTVDDVTAGGERRRELRPGDEQQSRRAAVPVLSRWLATCGGVVVAASVGGAASNDRPPARRAAVPALSQRHATAWVLRRNELATKHGVVAVAAPGGWRRLRAVVDERKCLFSEYSNDS